MQLVNLTDGEAESADETEQQQPPHLLHPLLDGTETAALRQLLPHRQPAGHVHPAKAETHTIVRKKSAFANHIPY